MHSVSYSSERIFRILSIKKSRYLILDLILILFSSCIHLLVGAIGTLFVFLISPFVCVRVARVNSKRLGHFLMEFDWYSSNVLEDRDQYIWDFFYFSGEVCNKFLESKWKKGWNVFPAILLNPIYLVLRSIGPLGSKHVVPLPVRPNSFSALDNLPSAIHFTAEEIVEGNRALRNLGVSPSDKVVCLFVRDSAYQKTISAADSQFSAYRDSNVNDYVPAIHSLIADGYKVIRMGKVSSGSTQIESPGFVDYVQSPYKSDLLDFYLVFISTYSICTDSGSMQIPISLRKPFGLVNVPGMHGLISSHYLKLFQFKTFYDSPSGKELTLRDLLNRGSWSFDNFTNFRNANISHKDNTPGELMAFVNELNQLFSTDFDYVEDYNRQKRKLNSLIKDFVPSENLANISLAWLAEHPNFLS